MDLDEWTLIDFAITAQVGLILCRLFFEWLGWAEPLGIATVVFNVGTFIVCGLCIYALLTDKE